MVYDLFIIVLEKNMSEKCYICGNSRAPLTGGETFSPKWFCSQGHRDQYNRQVAKDKQDKADRKQKEKERKQKERQSSNSSNSSANSGGGSNISGGEVLVAAAALTELFTTIGKKHQAKVNELKSLPIPSNPKDIKKSFMFLVSQFTLGGQSHFQKVDNRELADLIITKLETFLKYWKLECTSETDYESVKNMFEEEISALIEKRNKLKKMQIIGWSLYAILAIAGLIYILINQPPA